MALYTQTARVSLAILVGGKRVTVAPGETVELADDDVLKLAAFMRAGVFKPVAKAAEPKAAPAPQPEPVETNAPITSVVTVPETPKARRKRRRSQ